MIIVSVIASIIHNNNSFIVFCFSFDFLFIPIIIWCVCEFCSSSRFAFCQNTMDGDDNKSERMRNSLTKANERQQTHNFFVSDFLGKKLLITFSQFLVRFVSLEERKGRKNRLRRKTFYGFRWSSSRYCDYVTSRTVH